MLLATISLENNAGGCMAVLELGPKGRPVAMADTPYQAIGELLKKYGHEIMESETFERQLSINRETLTIEIRPHT